jgi:CRP/FNR family transcriptional regulator, dissimilatory nitrate respiration regulator
LPATFTASEDSVLLMATRTSVFKLISSVPDLLHRFLCVTGNCNKCTVTRLRILSYKMLRSRLVYYSGHRQNRNRITIHRTLSAESFTH